MRKTNWKVILLIYTPFLIISMGFFSAGILGPAIAWVLTLIVVKVFKIDMNVYYDHKGNRITKEKYEKLDNKVDYGFKMWR